MNIQCIRKRVTLLLVLAMSNCFLLMSQEKSFSSMIQKTWKELSSANPNEARFEAYGGKEIPESTYRLHVFRANGTIFTSTHHSNKTVKSAGLGFSDKDDAFIEESKWELKGSELLWYVKSSKFGMSSSTATNYKYKVIKLTQTELILKLIDTKITTL
ncbi:MAG: hypothetical protein HYU69_07900 [Bacteroidetes bacterium]|nr:hypothetical protein [Bacteroidota bacterium]